MGSCLTDATPGGRSGEPFVCFPLCCDSNGLRSNHRGFLTRWNHADLRVTKVVAKVWTNSSDCQDGADRRLSKRLMIYFVLEPPPQYLHPYHGAVIERVLPLAEAS